jgi:hypothetical protein
MHLLLFSILTSLGSQGDFVFRLKAFGCFCQVSALALLYTNGIMNGYDATIFVRFEIDCRKQNPLHT